MKVVFFIFFLGYGVWSLTNPESILRWRDRFRIRGDREYTDLAIGMTRFAGVLSIVMSFVVLFFMEM